MTTSPGPDLDFAAFLAAEAHRGATARNAHHLMDHRMIVRVGINAVAPHIAQRSPQTFFDHVFRIGRSGEMDASCGNRMSGRWLIRIRPSSAEFMGDGAGGFIAVGIDLLTRQQPGGSTRDRFGIV